MSDSYTKVMNKDVENFFFFLIQHVFVAIYTKMNYL